MLGNWVNKKFGTENFQDAALEWLKKFSSHIAPILETAAIWHVNKLRQRG